MPFTAPLPFGTSRVPNPFLLFLPVFVEESPAKRILWNHLKTHGVRKRLLQTPQELKRYVLGHMRSLQRTPALLRGFFKKPSLRYITA